MSGTWLEGAKGTSAVKEAVAAMEVKEAAMVATAEAMVATVVDWRDRGVARQPRH